VPDTLFISYRRADTHVWGRLIMEYLTKAIPGVEVLLDVVSSVPGDVFPEAIERNVRRADLVLALIGKEWLREVQDRDALSRNDYMRAELRFAIDSKVRIIPLLVDGAFMPQDSELPEDIRPVARLHAVNMSNETLDRDAPYLVETIRKMLEMKKKAKAVKALPPVVPQSQITPPSNPAANIKDVKLRDYPTPPQTKPAPTMRDQVRDAFKSLLGPSAFPLSRLSFPGPQPRTKLNFSRDGKDVLMQLLTADLAAAQRAKAHELVVKEWGGALDYPGEAYETLRCRFHAANIEGLVDAVMKIYAEVFGEQLRQIPTVEISLPRSAPKT
jgi:hypothetical protein